jgi:signal transduction histidine kinase/integral membrane sensor domain MASE1
MERDSLRETWLRTDDGRLDRSFTVDPWSRTIGTDGSPASAEAARRWTIRQTAIAALLTAAAYWLGAWVGLELTFSPTPVAALWPPNALLLAALLLAPTSTWWVLLASALPVHLFMELRAGVPLGMVLSWYLSNSMEALVGAGLVRHFLGGRVRLDNARAFGIFVLCATFFATFLSSFVDAGLVALNGWGDSPYWTVWRLRFLSNVLATQTIVPIVLAIEASRLVDLRDVATRRKLETFALAALLVVVCRVAFWLPPGAWKLGPALLYAPYPLLIWAAVRFGPLGISLSLGTVTVMAIWGAVHGGGPFTLFQPEENALSLQLFLFLAGVPLSLLVATSEERRRAERQAAESERLLSLTIRTAHIGIWSADLETGQFTADDVLNDMIGDPSAEAGTYAVLIEQTFLGREAPPGERVSGGTNRDALLQDRELEVQHRDGTKRCILARGMLLRRVDGSPFRITGIAIDITERKRIEQELHEHDERMALVARTADIGFWSIELATGEVWLSDHVYTMIGVPPATPSHEALALVNAEIPLPANMATFEQELARRGAIDDEVRAVRPDGTVRWFAYSARLERNAAGESVRIMGVSRDITDQRQAELDAAEGRSALSHLSRVATVGELTATIVHEVGQPLGAVALNAQSAVRLANASEIDIEELRATLDDVLRDSHRAGTVISQLRDLLRRNESKREQLDLREVVHEALELARGELQKQRIQISVSMPDERATVFANRAQLQQVLLNLVLNARDAINLAAPPRRQLLVTMTKGADSTVRVWVADSGGGIAHEHLGKVFEPFFTSKSEGLGLGLAVSRSIMLDHGGDLRAQNVDGGALMQLVIPEARVSPAPRDMPGAPRPMHAPAPAQSESRPAH